MDALLNNIAAVKSPRSREKLTAARARIIQNRKMVELDCDTELPISIDDLRVAPDYTALIEALQKWELKSVLQDVREEQAKANVTRQSELAL